MQGTRPFLLGVTGGIGSGKSIICKIFQCLGVPVYDADSRAKGIMHENEAVKAAIMEAFGSESYKEGVLQREYLGRIVFNDAEKLEVLNSITHPAVAKDFEAWVKANARFPYVVKEAALFVETGTYRQLDGLLLVSAPMDIKVQRVLARDLHRSREDVLQVMKKQLPDEEKRKYCQLEIVNDGTSPILSEVVRIHDVLRNRKKLF